MDELIKKIMGFGVPGIILTIAMSLSGYAGAAALTVALASLGPFGMLGGIAVLGAIGFSADKITEYGIEKIAKGVVRERLKTQSKDELKKEIRKYYISKSMKLKICDFIDRAAVD
ncbi:hypothetical protein Llac01_14530 [Leuconostoc lactis]|uniref:hypothetical protein n=1 Tax=Leuconostoc lactis TaxID=1246 RepID=UPI0024A2D366|nr:hypothetical protein [Leuconostoc lactis]GLY46076.1 hypothetical protein Llac01_14530 [Leuconostoc lactis]